MHRLPFLSRWWFPTTCFSTVSPSPLTAEAPHQSPDDSSPYGSRKPGTTIKYISEVYMFYWAIALVENPLYTIKLA
jgi:hypothetical protein